MKIQIIETKMAILTLFHTETRNSRQANKTDTNVTAQIVTTVQADILSSLIKDGSSKRITYPLSN
jgi:hypothetical protein